MHATQGKITCVRACTRSPCMLAHRTLSSTPCTPQGATGLRCGVLLAAPHAATCPRCLRQTPSDLAGPPSRLLRWARLHSACIALGCSWATWAPTSRALPSASGTHRPCPSVSVPCPRAISCLSPRHSHLHALHFYKWRHEPATQCQSTCRRGVRQAGPAESASSRGSPG